MFKNEKASTLTSTDKEKALWDLIGETEGTVYLEYLVILVGVVLLMTAAIYGLSVALKSYLKWVNFCVGLPFP